jgi:hypothetical protein
MIIELLESKGFVEDLDFTFDGQTLTALEKTRDAEQIIHHDAIEDILGTEGDVVVPGTPAYDEVIIVQETYYPSIPSLNSLKSEIVRSKDVALLVGKYLEGKSTTDEDSLNLELFLNTGSGWRFASVNPPTISQLYDLIPSVEAEQAAQAQKQARIASGAADRAKCQNALDLIAGYNRERTLSFEQITQLQQTFAQAESLLRASRPDFAKQVITALVPDGILVTQEMKQDVLSLLE